MSGEQLLTGANIAISVLMWVPAWRKMRARQSSADYSVVTVLGIIWLQLSNAGLALRRGHWLELVWFLGNGVLVGVTLAVILYYRQRRGGKRDGMRQSI